MKQYKKGNILIMTVILFAVIMIMGTGLLTKAVSSYRISADQIIRQQGYYVTKSALDACKSTIEKKDKNMIALLKEVASGAPKETSWQKFGETGYEYQVALEKNSQRPEEVIIEARARRGEEITDTLQGVVSKSGSSGGSGIMADQILGSIKETIEKLVPNKGQSDSSTLVIGWEGTNEDIVATGNVEVKGPVNGNIYAAGNVTVSGPMNGNVVAGGEIQLMNGVLGNSDRFIYGVEKIDIRGNAEAVLQSMEGIYLSGGLTGAAYCIGDIDIRGTVQGNIVASGSVNIPLNITGSIYAKGSVDIRGVINADGSGRKGICADGNIYVPNALDADVCVGDMATLGNGFRGNICGNIQSLSNVANPEKQICKETIPPGETRHHHEWCKAGQGEEVFTFEKYQ